MTDMKGIRCGVKADIEGRPAVVDEIADLRLIRQLGQKSSCLKFLKNLHVFFHR